MIKKLLLILCLLLLPSICSATWSTGSKNVPGDYNTIQLAVADLAATLTGNCTINITADVTETVMTHFNSALAGYTFTITTPAGTGRHSGYEQAGDYVVTTNMTDSYLLYIEGNGPGTIEISWTRFNETAVGGDGMFRVYNPATGYTFNFHHNISDCTTGAKSHIVYGDSKVTSHIYNNVFIAGIYGWQGMVGTNIIENNSSYGVAIGWNGTATYNNNAVFGGTNRSFYEVASSTGNANCTYDATGDWGTNFYSGTGNLASKTFDNNFSTSTATNSDFFKVKSDATDVKDVGAAGGTYSTTDIRGNTRPATKTEWDIGADEYTAAAAATPPFFSIINVE